MQNKQCEKHGDFTVLFLPAYFGQRCLSSYLWPMKILDGQLVSQATKQELKIKVADLLKENKRVPHLAAVLVGNNGASETYVASKVRTCEEIGYRSTLIRLEDTVTEEELLKEIAALNHQEDVDGILVQLPLPKGISEQKVIDTIDPNKDVDGFSSVNVGRMVQGLSTFVPATPYGIMLLLEYYRIDTKGMNAVVIGRSNIVGRPISVLLSNATNPGNCTVTVCHSQTRNIKEISRKADLIVAALGKPAFLTADMVKEGAVVIDIGTTRVEGPEFQKGWAIKGDVDFKNVSRKAAFITPVPGGVGPMTIASLLLNTLRATEARNP